MCMIFLQKKSHQSPITKRVNDIKEIFGKLQKKLAMLKTEEKNKPTAVQKNQATNNNNS